MGNKGRWVAVVLVVIFLFLFSWTKFEVNRIEREIPPIGEFVSVEGGEVDIHYLQKGSGIPVVLLHGRDGTLQEFTFSIFEEVAEEYRVIALDRPGYGYSRCSDREKLTTQGQARLINEALQKLGVKNPILVGHSYGGAVMLQYLLDYPEKVAGAISLGGVAYVDEPPEEGFFALPRVPVLGPFLTHTLVVPLGRKFAEGIYKQAFWPDRVPEDYVKTIASLYIRPVQFISTSYELEAMHDSVRKISPRYSEIKKPVTIIFGDSDQMLDYKEDGLRLYEELSSGEFILVEGGGHKVHHTHSEIVLNALGEISQKVNGEPDQEKF